MNPLMKIQADASRDAMQAKQDFEIESQTKKVEALAQQVRERSEQLAERAKQVSYDALYADERALYLGGHGYFGKDTETLDVLIAALSEESQTLDHMRGAAAKTRELHAIYEERIEREAPGEAMVVTGDAPVPDGAEVFEMPAGSGAYL